LSNGVIRSSDYLDAISVRFVFAHDGVCPACDYPGQYFGAVIPSDNLASERMAVCAIPPSRGLMGKQPGEALAAGLGAKITFLD
jgi:hypothetical protein